MILFQLSIVNVAAVVFVIFVAFDAIDGVQTFPVSVGGTEKSSEFFRPKSNGYFQV